MRVNLLLKNFLFFSVLANAVLISQVVTAQLVVNAVTPEEAVNNILLGNGLTANNITYTGNPNQMGSFQCTGCNLGLPSGVILSTGFATNAAGPNSNGGSSDIISETNSPDADLNQLYSTATRRDLCKLEFDFVPMGDSFVFEFVFGSDEYPEWINSPQWNDIFGFFLSGPGISGPFSNNGINLAVVPGTSTYVGIQTIRNGTTGLNGPCVNCEYYIHNGTGTQAPYNSASTYIQPDGFTVVMQVKAYVQCGETYHIKMAIADTGDSSYNSWVFLKEGSFQSAFDLAFDIPDIAPDGSVYEGCGNGTLVIGRPCGLEGDLTVLLNYGGTATAGADYLELPSEVTIPTGEDFVAIPFATLNDTEVESTETISITAALGQIVGTTTLNLLDTPELSVEIEDLIVPCNEDAVLNLNVSGGSGSHTIAWAGMGSSNPLVIENPEEQTVSYTVTDVCNPDNPTTGNVNIALQEYDPIMVSLGDDINATCNTTEDLTPSVSGGDGNYSYVWTSNGEIIGNGSTQTVAAQSGINIVVSVTDGCGVSSSDELSFIVDPQDIVVSIGESPITTNCITPVTFEPVVTGGTGNYQYSWAVNGTPVSSANVHTAQVNSNTEITITVTDECGGLGVDVVNILVPPVPVVITNIPDMSVPCLSSFTLTSQVSGGVSSNYSYAWTSNGASAGSMPSITTSISQPTTIVLTVTDQCGNSSTETINIGLNPSAISVEIFADDMDVCPNEDVLLTAEIDETIGSVNYVWSVQGASGANVVVSSPVTASYTVTITDACSYTATDTYEMLVWESSPLMVPGPDYVLCTNILSGYLVAGGVPPYSYQFDDNVLDLSDGRFISSYSDISTPVIVTDHCDSTAVFDIDLSACDTKIPNIFTPNNDLYNAQFVIDGIEGFPGSSLEIYNRWGNKIFESKSYKNDWNGSEQEDGTYYYIFNRSDGVGFSGHLQLVR